MKLRLAVAVVVFASLLIFASANLAKAGWSAMSSGYAVTTNWHGIDVTIGESVTAWAGTTDDTVQWVEFIWKDPDGNVAWDIYEVFACMYTTPSVPADAPPEIEKWASNNPGIDVWYAQNTYTPSEWTGTIIGDWTVKARFLGAVQIPPHDSTAFRATSSFVIPEVSFGTIAILLSMFGALAMKKKRIL